MSEKRSETIGGVILVGIGLVTMVLVAWGVYVGMGRSIDGAELLQERFAFEVAPFGLQVEEAHQLASGDRIARLARAIDAEGVPADAPETVVALFHVKPQAPGLLFPPGGSTVEAEQLAKWKADASQVFKGEINRGTVAFGPWETPYIRERLFRDTGKWVDSMRVNLSGAGTSCVLFVEFPPEVDGNEQRLVELLEGLELRSAE